VFATVNACITPAYWGSPSQPIVRRIITRAISIIPSVVVAVAVGRSGVNQLLVASQVCLSVVLPFVIFPLVWICSDKKVMTVTNSPTDASESTIGVQRATQLGLGSNEQTDPEASPIIGDGIPTREADRIRPDDESVTRPEAEVAQALDAVAPKSKSFTSHWIVTVLGYALFAVVTVSRRLMRHG
jgi:metal iron transporter